MNIKELLDTECEKRNTINELTLDKPDPLFVAKKHSNEYIALICALFGYGNAGQIIKFLDSLDYSLLDQDEDIIKKQLVGKYYRFQNQDDVIAIFIALGRLKKEISLNELFLQEYNKEQNIINSIHHLINTIYSKYEYSSKGYSFLIGNSTTKNSPLKRWNMYLRWMVRFDNLDLGLWKGVDKKDLLLPLDTHTFKVSQKLGLLNRKTYDMKSVQLITNKLKEFDQNDPIKYDFALYRIGQEKIL